MRANKSTLLSHLPKAAQFFNYGGILNQSNPFLYRHGHTMGASLLHQAIMEDRTDDASAFIRDGADIENATTSGHTALHWAVRKNNATVVNALLQKKANVEALDNAKATPLHWAAREGSVEAMVAMIKIEGARLNVNVIDKLQYTPLHWAANKGYDPILLHLLEQKADVQSIDSSGRTPFHLACEEGHQSAMAILAEHKADLGCVDRYKYTALHLAARGGHLDVIKVLLDWGADIEAVTQEGFSPLHLAAQGGNGDVVKFLYGHGANHLAVDHEGRSVFDLGRHNSQVLSALAGPKLLRIWRGKKTAPGQTPIYTPIGSKVGGCCPGFLVQTDTGKGYIAKLSLPDDSKAAKQHELSADITRRRKVLYLSHTMAVLEKVAADIFAILGQGYFYTAKHRLAMLEMQNAFTKENFDYLWFFSNINQGKKPEECTTKGLHLLSKMVKGYQDLSALKYCALKKHDSSLQPFRDFLEKGRLPAFARVEKHMVPILGLVEVLAVARLLGDTDVFGGRADNAGVVVERDEVGKPVALRVVKIDAGEAFGFTKPHNQLYQAEQNFDTDHLEYRGNRLKDKRDIQFGNNHPVSIIWNKLSKIQKNNFLMVFRRGLLLLQKVSVMKELIARKGVFNRAIEGPRELITDRILRSLLHDWHQNLALQVRDDVYGGFLREGSEKLKPMQAGEQVGYQPKVFDVADYTEEDVNALIASHLPEGGV